MKKYIAFLLCIIIVFSLFSCNSQNSNDQLPPDNNGENNNDTSADTDDGKNDNNGSSDTDFGQIIDSTDYYKIKEIGLGKHEYHIYDRWGKEVLVEVTNRPLRISIIDKLMIEIRIGMGTGTSVSKYYDIQNDRFSEEYLNVVAVSGNLLACVGASQDDGATKGSLVVRDIFDINEFFKTFSLDFSPREVMPISHAEFTEREMALELIYLNQNSEMDESVTLPIRTSTFDNDAFTEADLAIMAYEQVLNGEKPVFDTRWASYFYLMDVSTPYNMTHLQDEENLEYAYTDMDKDGVSELVIDCGDTLILRYYEGTVYLYSFVFRNLYYLQTDGSHSWNHNGSDFEYGENQLYFEGIDIKERSLWHIVNDGEPNAEYYVGDKRVTEEEILKYFEDNPKTKIKFSPLEVSWMNKISQADAVLLAQAYWNPFGDEGEKGYIIVSGYNENAPLFVYVILKKHYVEDHWSVIDEIWIDKNTGEAIIPHIFDGGKG